MRTTRFQVPTTLEGLPVWMIDERGPGCVDEDLAKNNRGPIRKRVGAVRESLRSHPWEASGLDARDDDERVDRNSPDRWRKGNRSGTLGVDTPGWGSLAGGPPSKNKENQDG